MRSRHSILLLCVIILVTAWAAAQQPAVPENPGTTTIRAETKLVLVDAIVTDKSGRHITDLEQKNFKVWEDGKEQAITSFSLERSQVNPSQERRQYMVLFFDNSNMQTMDQAKARDAAMKFIDANAAANRLMAVVDFGGTLRISQNFTADAARLKTAVKNLKTSTVSGNLDTASAPSAALTQLEADFGTHTVLLALGRVAQGLATVPGRKSLVLLTSGFPLNSEISAEITSVIAICNRANVAVYPIDIRGLTAPDMSISTGDLLSPPSLTPDTATATLTSAVLRYSGQPRLQLASFLQPLPNVFAQKGGAPAGGGAHPPAGGTGASHAPGGRGPTVIPAPGTRGPVSSDYNVYGPQGTPPPSIIVPDRRQNASENQQVMWQLADGTGGFVIINSNDLLGALQRIADDQSEYYLLGYKPPSSEDGACHTIKVKVDRSGTTIRARTGYCNLKLQDSLAGKPEEKDLENHAKTAGVVKAAMTAPFFYTSPNIARVDLSLDIPSGALNFDTLKGKQHAAVNILGIAYKADGSVAARFSDRANLDFDDKKKMEAFLKQPLHYDAQFELASGEYKLVVVFSAGDQNFGKIEMPLTIDPYKEKQFAISSVALSNDIRQVSDSSLEIESALMQNKTPLLAKGLEFMPSASNQFKTTDVAAIYAEVYEPLLKDPNPPEVAYELVVHDRKSGAEKLHVGQKIEVKQGNPVVPFGVRIPVDQLGPGEYRAELTAVDSQNNWSTTRVADFEIQ
ncbi:MAG TPA: VWA domain-containing protein [Terriglobales bacterium]|nr:VWA domain-containing protein [Terriglobales bacterium]